MATLPLVRSVVHATDFSEASEAAFAHALAITLLRQAHFTILHVSRSKPDEGSWTRFPSVRKTLERWQLLEPGSSQSDVLDKFGVRVRKVHLIALRPGARIVDYLASNPADLVVLATGARRGLPRWLRPSTAERIANRVESLTLFVPENGRSFVEATSAKTSLQRVLIPMDFVPSAQPALDLAVRAAKLLGDDQVEITLMHAGEVVPSVRLPEEPSLSFRSVAHAGDPVDAIIETADTLKPNLIVMVSDGPRSWLERLRGSTTEMVLRRAQCPLLLVPRVWADRFSYPVG